MKRLTVEYHNGRVETADFDKSEEGEWRCLRASGILRWVQWVSPEAIKRRLAHYEWLYSWKEIAGEDF